MKFLVLVLLFVVTFVSASDTLWGVNNYIEFHKGTLPIILVGPHTGSLKPSDLPDISDHDIDNGTMETLLGVEEHIATLTGGCRPYSIINHIHPSKMLASYDIDSAAGEHPIARQAWSEFHEFIDTAKARIVKDWGSGHYFELHGNGHPEKWNEIGHGVSKEHLALEEDQLYARRDLSTIRNIAQTADFIQLLRGPQSLGGLLDSMGWKSTPSPTYPSPDPGNFFFAGWNTWLHGSRYEGTIDATHVESYWEFMVLEQNKESYQRDLAQAIVTFMETHYGFDLSCTTAIINTTPTNYLESEPPFTLQRGLITFDNEYYDNVTLYDIHGRKLNMQSIADGRFSVSVADGVYFLQWRNNHEETAYRIRKLFVH